MADRVKVWVYGFCDSSGEIRKGWVNPEHLDRSTRRMRCYTKSSGGSFEYRTLGTDLFLTEAEAVSSARKVLKQLLVQAQERATVAQIRVLEFEEEWGCG